MFSALGQLVHRRRRWVLVIAGLLTVLSAAFGPAVADAVKSGGFSDPGSQSAEVTEILEQAYGRTSADVLVVLSRADLGSDDPAFQTQAEKLVAGLPADVVSQALTPWTPGLPPETAAALLGSDGRSVLVALTLTGADEDARQAQLLDLTDDLAVVAPWSAQTGGQAAVYAEMQNRAADDIARAEMLAMPVLLVLLLLIFGGVVAALLPVTVGVVAILGAMGLLRALTLVTDVSSFAVNVTTILGLGLAIDYSLFMISRFREELRRTDDVEQAVRATVSTAGRTVVFSGVTVLIAFAGLLFFPQMFLRSMGLGGMAVVLLDMVLAVTLLPAVLSVLGHRVDAGRLPAGLTARLAGGPRRWFSGRDRAGAGRAAVPGAGLTGTRDGEREALTTERPAHGWAHVARVVLRFPRTVVAGSVALLVVLALPLLGLQVADGDARELPASSSARQATEQIGALFPLEGGTVLDVVLRPVEEQGSAGQGVDPDVLSTVQDTLAGVPGVGGVAVLSQDGGLAHLTVTSTLLPDTPQARDLVAALREVPVPAGTELLVGGAAAVSADSIAAIVSTAPWTAAFIALVTFLLLFLALGSVVAPLKAVLMNMLSLGATFGVLTWAFVDGNLAGAAGFTAVGTLAPGNLVLIAVVAFGLAMDYELFLLSRIREAHLRGEGTDQAITSGLVASGRTITSAALLLVVVLVAMATSGVTFLKLVGLGLAFAVALDATVVRGFLVPATLKLLGRATWWLPAPLRRLHDRFGISEGEGLAAAGHVTGGARDREPGLAPEQVSGLAPELAGSGQKA